MPIASLFVGFRTSVSRFVRADQGNIATIFAITILPILGFIGAAIDYTRVSGARSAMQSALDETALMISKDVASGIVAPSDVTTKAQAYFNALYTNKDASNVHVSANYTPNSSMGSTIQINGSGSMTTDFLKVAGFPQLDFNTTSTTAWGNARMRVAMALDNTGSMASDGKIGALQTASKNLIDQLSGLAKTQGDVYISIVPFSKDVNVGNVNSANSAQNWIDWTSWELEAPDLVGSSKKPNGWSSIGPNSNCPWSLSSNGFTCVSGPGSTTAVSKIPNTGTYSGYICPGPDPTNTRYSYKYHFLINGCYDTTGSSPNYVHTWRPNPHSMWSGCITDRTPPYNTQKTTASTTNTATLFPAEQYFENNESYCVANNTPPLQPIIPLSYDWTALKNAVGSMQPTGGTNQTIGLAWAWETLQQGAPMNAPAEDSNYTYSKALIILSDGLNTEDRWPADGDGGTQFNNAIDNSQKQLCDAIKLDKVTIYTIQVNTSKPADATSSVLQYCASSTDKFYLLYSASQVISAFNSIGTSLAQLRVAK